ncbi:hypothetical protein STEG23_012521, partial [Scotinomys teguina]
MGDLPGLVRLSIALRIQPNDGPVFFKVDGQRFGQNRTIKLLTGSSYKVEVKIKPTTLQVENISIGGVLVPLELKCQEPDGERVVYTGIYDTEGVAPTKSGERQPIQITMPPFGGISQRRYELVMRLMLDEEGDLTHALLHIKFVPLLFGLMFDKSSHIDVQILATSRKEILGYKNGKVGVFSSSRTGVFSFSCLVLDSSSSFPCPAFLAIAKSTDITSTGMGIVSVALLQTDITSTGMGIVSVALLQTDITSTGMGIVSVALLQTDITSTGMGIVSVALLQTDITSTGMGIVSVALLQTDITSTGMGIVSVALLQTDITSTGMGIVSVALLQTDITSTGMGIVSVALLQTDITSTGMGIVSVALLQTDITSTGMGIDNGNIHLPEVIRYPDIYSRKKEYIGTNLYKVLRPSQIVAPSGVRVVKHCHLLLVSFQFAITLAAGKLEDFFYWCSWKTCARCAAFQGVPCLALLPGVGDNVNNHLTIKFTIFHAFSTMTDSIPPGPEDTLFP